ncbi:hypothetical protein HU755_07655 [Pseudomonas sp. SWRI111]|uniref:hypothetical protein n=1 Tax=Pseudomonas sp. SWRI111 TaxID=2745507 RepID=UPI001649207F|nr:hypothetical protein [Pseudomonas sp. SWRI111]MBC3206655.1 hypothetical protein [Pseudomonas sp. SWRI111]
MVRELTTKADFRVWVAAQDQKIAAFGSSYRGMRSDAGAAEGCDLLIFLTNATALGRCFALKRPF